MIELLKNFGIIGIVILAGAALIVVWVLILALVFFVKASNIKKIGVGGAEFYDDAEPKKRAPRVKKPSRRAVK